MPAPDLHREARDFLMRIPPKHARQVLMKILDLCGNPTPPDSKVLKGTTSTFHRADAGEYRIVYRVDRDVLKVELIGKHNDDEVYKEMRRRGL